MEVTSFLNMQVGTTTANILRLFAKQLGVKHGDAYMFDLDLDGKNVLIVLSESQSLCFSADQNVWYHLIGSNDEYNVNVITKKVHLKKEDIDSSIVFHNKGETNFKLLDLFSPLNL